MSLIASIARSFDLFAKRPALYVDDRVYTYAEFGALVRAIQARLPSIDPYVGIISHADFPTYAGVLGVLFSGAGYVPLPTHNPIERTIKIIRLAGIRTIIASRTDALAQRLAREPGLSVLCIDALTPDPGSIEPKSPHNAGAAYLLFTSGSTGAPKGVPISRRNLDLFFDAFCELGLALDETDCFLHPFDLAFDFSVISLLLPLAFGAAVCAVTEEKLKFQSIYRLLSERDITFAPLVPSMASFLLRSSPAGTAFPKVRHTLFSGEALSHDLARAWHRCAPHAKIINAYGPTEATVFCMSRLWTPDIKGAHVPLGKPMKHTRTLVVDEKKNPVPSGSEGELCLAGTLTEGYLSDPERNNESFFTHEGQTYYRTGDVVRADQNGEYVFCGRVDTQVKIGGHRIELSEVEACAAKHPSCRTAVAVPYRTSLGLEAVHLFAEMPAGKEEDMRNFLIGHLPAYMVPHRITCLARIPLSRNGKRELRKLRELSQT